VRGFGVLDATVIAGLGLFGRHVEQAACLGHVVGARAAGEQAVVADDPSILKTERPPVHLRSFKELLRQTIARPRRQPFPRKRVRSLTRNGRQRLILL